MLVLVIFGEASERDWTLTQPNLDELFCSHLFPVGQLHSYEKINKFIDDL